MRERRSQRCCLEGRCPCCQRDDEVAVYGYHPPVITDRYGKSWRLASCDHCGVEYQPDPMSDAERKEFYGSGEYRRLCEQVTGKPWTDRAYLEEQQRIYGYKWLLKLGAYLPRGNGHKWLDYGGSTGVASGALNQGVPNIADMRIDFSEIIVADYGDGAPYTPEQAWKLGPYDAILCCQTLDHLREPLVTLRKFREVACQNARLFVDVVKKSHTEYKIDHDTYFPSAQSFVALVERAGWEIVWLDCETNPTHYSVLAEKR
jgi:hypothetical protein